MLKVLSSILCDLDPKVKVIGQKAGICDGVPSTSALVVYIKSDCMYRMKIACTVQVSFGLVLVLMPVEIIRSLAYLSEIFGLIE